MELWKRIKANKHCYLWIAPFFILFFLLCVYPTCYGIYLSFTNYDGMAAPEFIGMKNYVRMFNDKKFFQSMSNTFVLWVLIVPARTLLSLIAATLLNSKKVFGRKVYYAVLLLPYITAVAVVAIIFRVLMVTNGGIINVLLQTVGIGPIGWLDTVEWSKISVALMNIWRMTGYFALVMLAGMQKIPNSVYEAAELDGAGPVKRFTRIILPLMVPEIFFVFVISTIWVFQNIGDVMVLTQGGPLNSSTNLVYYIYLNAFQYSKMGYASAMSTVLFVLLVGVSAVMVRGYSAKLEE